MTRTPDTRFRKPLLYPPELRGPEPSWCSRRAREPSCRIVVGGRAAVNHKTALIPTIPGGLLALLGFAGQRETLRRWTMRGALLVALLGLVGAFMGRRPGADPKAKAARALMASTCATYLALSTRSYLVGRCAGARHESQAQVDA